MWAFGGLLRGTLKGVLARMPPQRAIVEIHWSTVFFRRRWLRKEHRTAVSRFSWDYSCLLTAPVNYRLRTSKRY